jgi:hypothetical protein
MMRVLFMRRSVIAVAAFASAVPITPACAWEFSISPGYGGEPACTAETVVKETAVGFKGHPGAELWAYADGFTDEGDYLWEVSGAEAHKIEAYRSPIGTGGSISLEIPLRMFRDLIAGQSLSIRADAGQGLKVPLQGAADALKKFIACYTGLATFDDFLDKGAGGTMASMFSLAGECKEFRIAGERNDCMPGIYRTAYDTGATSFSALSNDKQLAVAFIGKPGVRRFQGKLMQSVQMLAIQPLSGKDPIYTAAIGSCTYGGFMGTRQATVSTEIRCAATDGDGKYFSFIFEKSPDAPVDVTK